MAKQTPAPRNDQLAPFSTELEEAVLGAILINPDVLPDIIGTGITGRDFFLSAHRHIYEAILTARRQNVPVEVLTVVECLTAAGALTEVGGAARVLSLAHKTPNSLNADGYARAVRSLSIRRGLIDAAGQIARLAHSETTPIEEVVIKSAEIVADPVAQVARMNERVPSMEELSDGLAARAEARHKNPVAIVGTTTGFDDIDRACGGFRDGTFALVAARPGMGKSALMASMVWRQARRGVATLLFSMEDTAEAVIHRMACQMARADSIKVEEGNATPDETVRYLQALHELKRYHRLITIDQKGGKSTDEIAASIHRHRREAGIKVAYVDTINKCREFLEAENTYIGMTRVSNRLAMAALDFPEVCIVGMAQLSRSGVGEAPKLEHLRDSGALEQDARLVLGLHRPGYYADPGATDHATLHDAMIGVIKNTHGPSRRIAKLFYDERWPGYAPAVASSALDAARAREATI